MDHLLRLETSVWEDRAFCFLEGWMRFNGEVVEILEGNTLLP